MGRSDIAMGDINASPVWEPGPLLREGASN